MDYVIFMVLLTFLRGSNGFFPGSVSFDSDLPSNPLHSGLGSLSPHRELSTSYNSQSWKAILKSTTARDNKSDHLIARGLERNAENSLIRNANSSLNNFTEHNPDKSSQMLNTTNNESSLVTIAYRETNDNNSPNDLHRGSKNFEGGNNKINSNNFDEKQPIKNREYQPMRSRFRRFQSPANFRINNRQFMEKANNQIKGKTNEPNTDAEVEKFGNRPTRFSGGRHSSSRREAEFPDSRRDKKDLTPQTSFHKSSEHGARTLPLRPSIADLGRRNRHPKLRRTQALRQNREGREFSGVFAPLSPSSEITSHPEFGMKINSGQGTFKEMNSHRAFNDNTSLFFTLSNNDAAFDFSDEFNRHHDLHFRPNPLLSLVPPIKSAQEEVPLRINANQFGTHLKVDSIEPRRSPSVFHIPNGGVRMHPDNFRRHAPNRHPQQNQNAQHDRNSFHVTFDIDSDDNDDVTSAEFFRPIIAPAVNGHSRFLSPPPPPSVTDERKEQASSFGRIQLRKPQLLRKSESHIQEGGYKFGYEVRGDEGASHGHKEERKGNRVEGVYHVDLPNGYRQIVSYYADETGYHPTITYEKIHGFEINGRPKALPSTLIRDLVPPSLGSSEEYRGSSAPSEDGFLIDLDKNFRETSFPLTFSNSDRYEVAYLLEDSSDKRLGSTMDIEFPESTYDTLDGIPVAAQWGDKKVSPFYGVPPPTVVSPTYGTTHPESLPPTVTPTTTPEPPIIDPMYIRIESKLVNSTVKLANTKDQ